MRITIDTSSMTSRKSSKTSTATNNAMADCRIYQTCKNLERLRKIILLSLLR